LLFPAYMMAAGAAILLIAPAFLTFMNFRQKNMIASDIQGARNFLENEDKKLRSPDNAAPADPDYNFPKEWYYKVGNRPSRAEIERKKIEGLDETDEAKAAEKKKTRPGTLPSFAPKNGQ
jgi:hypothetical protein